MKPSLILITLVGTLLCAISCRQKQPSDPTAEIRKHIVLMSEANTTDKRNAEKEWAADSLNFEIFADQALRTQYLHGWVELYRNSSGSDFQFEVTDAAKQLISRAELQTPEQVKPIVYTLCDYLLAAKDIGIAASIAAYPYGIDTAPDEYSEIAERLLGMTLLPGQRAPAIEGIGAFSTPVSATLLLFYETGCHNCGPLIDQITEAYEILLSMNVRVITVSSDVDPVIYAEYAAKMPWKDKICDFQSFAGSNFRRYWVAATPTMWLINEKGIVVDQYSTLDETGLLR